MKTDVRSSIALILLAVGSSAVAGRAQAQDVQPPQPTAPPPPAAPQAPTYQPPPAPVYQQPQAPAYQPPPQAPTYQPPPPPAYQQPQAPTYQQPPPAYQQPQAPTYQQPPPPPAYQQAPAYPQPPPPAYQQQPPQPYVPPAPPPQQYAPPPPAVPQSPPPARYPTSPQYSYPATQPAAPQQPAPPPAAQYGKAQWVNSSDNEPVNGFHYHPFRFHIDGGGTLTEKSNSAEFSDGWNAGFGLTWYPTAVLPLGIRVDGTYNQFNIKNPLLWDAAAANGPGIYHGFQRMYGGDTDLELDLHLSPYVRAYFLAGGGWYKQETIFRQTVFTNGYGCNWYGCGPGYVGLTGTVARNNSDWTFARNAGFGMEFATGPDASIFVEARYMRLNPTDAKSDYIPIRIGLRF